MPILVLVFALIAVLAVMVLAVPLSIVQRYRVGTAKRVAYGWVATVNAVAIAISASILVFVAAISGPWVPGAVRYTLGGLAIGAALGLVGLLATRWSDGPRLEYTPSRILVLSITLVVLARLLYGLYRGWRAWGMTTDTSWLAEAGAAGSMGAGGVVIGYYLIYWLGVRRKINRHRQQTARGVRGSF